MRLRRCAWGLWLIKGSILFSRDSMEWVNTAFRSDFKARATRKYVYVFHHCRRHATATMHICLLVFVCGQLNERWSTIFGSGHMIPAQTHFVSSFLARERKPNIDSSKSQTSKKAFRPPSLSCSRIARNARVFDARPFSERESFQSLHARNAVNAWTINARLERHRIRSHHSNVSERKAKTMEKAINNGINYRALIPAVGTECATLTTGATELLALAVHSRSTFNSLRTKHCDIIRRYPNVSHFSYSIRF